MNEPELLADLAATFPGLDARALRAFSKDYQGPGAWFSRRITMPDGLPIYFAPYEVGDVEPEGYSFFVHDGFQAWLKRRGWYVETYDYGTYFVLPLSSLLQCAEAA